ncbi:MAG TPA: HAMP domain-containing sensor histidine kinase [Verrucomicrobiota bacterium]|nr:hypothetical protein [Verrucomicrobiales bacterium]HRI16836.1 HAMP domain-containing sensor histidine kinase [Verrucomicrobiota bacterium]
MRLPLPLYARFFAWFLLNLVLLGIVFWGVVRSEFRVESLLAAFAGDRAQQVADVVYGELRTRPAEQWDETLARFGNAYGVDFVLLGDRRERIAGAPIEIPEALRERVRGPGPRPGTPGPRSFDGPPLSAEFPREPGLGRPEPRMPRTFFRSTEPPGYWLVARPTMPPGERGRPPGLLAVRSTTLSAGGLFIDFRPWWIAGGAVLLISALWWIPFIGSITRCVGQMTKGTERIAEGRFDVVVNDRRNDELGRLGSAINRLSSRLEGFVTGQKRFLGDIAHELCSPLARMEIALGVIDQRATEPQREYLEDVRSEVRQMSGLVNELLQFTKAGLQPPEASRREVQLDALVKEVVDRECTSDSNVVVSIPPHLVCRTDPERLGRALANLVRNAIRYAGAAGPITVSGSATGERITLTVADEGPGVPEPALARLGEPFFRPDLARGRETGGTGLGLAIVRSCVEGCSGTITFQNRQPAGFVVTIMLPTESAHATTP